MTAPNEVSPLGVLEPFDQRKQRTDMTAEDQFGRPWAIVIENRTQEITAMPKPAGWTDHLGTPARVIRVPLGKFGQRKLGDLYVDTKAWIDSATEAQQRWKDSFWTWAQIRFPTELPNMKPEDIENHPVLVKDAGRRPWPSPDMLTYIFTHPTEAVCDEILMGRAERLTDEASAFLGRADIEMALVQDGIPRDYKGFLSWCARQTPKKGKTLNERAALWKKHLAGEVI